MKKNWKNNLFYDLENEKFIEHLQSYIEASGEKLSIDDLDGETLQNQWVEFKG